MRKCALVILDGWGIGENAENNAIYKSNTDFFDSIWRDYPHTILEASGEFVGLPKGQIGGSEVGHLTIGAGRVLYQSLPRFSKSIEGALNGTAAGWLEEPAVKHLINAAQVAPIHLVGLVSDGGVHSHIDQLLVILEILKKTNCREPYIHIITDGRDTPPQSGMACIERLLSVGFGKIVTLSGRYYAMDRDQNWDRTAKAVQAIVWGNSEKKVESEHQGKTAVLYALNQSYNEQVNDEFVEPVVVDASYDGIGKNESVFFYNFRADRMKQLVSEVASKIGDERVITMMKYDKDFPYIFLFDKEQLSNTLGEYISRKGLTQFKAAETEKAPHVTYFFNGGVEVIFDGEVRSIAQSNKVTHEKMPEMKAVEIEEHVVAYVLKHHPDFILVNFANPDMVGHTGVFEAVVKGVETVDKQLEKLCSVLKAQGYAVLVTADHGNADIMYDLETNEPHTAHTLNPVPFVLYSDDLKNKKLDDTAGIGLDRIAGTVCEVMELEVPKGLSPV